MDEADQKLIGILAEEWKRSKAESSIVGLSRDEFLYKCKEQDLILARIKVIQAKPASHGQRGNEQQQLQRVRPNNGLASPEIAVSTRTKTPVHELSESAIQSNPKTNMTTSAASIMEQAPQTKEEIADKLGFSSAGDPSRNDLAKSLLVKPDAVKTSISSTESASKADFNIGGGHDDLSCSEKSSPVASDNASADNKSPPAADGTTLVSTSDALNDIWTDRCIIKTSKVVAEKWSLLLHNLQIQRGVAIPIGAATRVQFTDYKGGTVTTFIIDGKHLEFMSLPEQIGLFYFAEYEPNRLYSAEEKYLMTGTSNQVVGVTCALRFCDTADSFPFIGSLSLKSQDLAAALVPHVKYGAVIKKSSMLFSNYVERSDSESAPAHWKVQVPTRLILKGQWHRLPVSLTIMIPCRELDPNLQGKSEDIPLSVAEFFATKLDDDAHAIIYNDIDSLGIGCIARASFLPDRMQADAAVSIHVPSPGASTNIQATNNGHASTRLSEGTSSVVFKEVDQDPLGKEQGAPLDNQASHGGLVSSVRKESIATAPGILPGNHKREELNSRATTTICLNAGKSVSGHRDIIKPKARGSKRTFSGTQASPSSVKEDSIAATSKAMLSHQKRQELLPIVTSAFNRYAKKTVLGVEGSVVPLTQDSKLPLASGEGSGISTTKKARHYQAPKSKNTDTQAPQRSLAFPSFDGSKYKTAKAKLDWLKQINPIYEPKCYTTGTQTSARRWKNIRNCYETCFNSDDLKFLAAFTNEKGTFNHSSWTCAICQSGSDEEETKAAHT